jgi:hypothetical protein
MYFVLLFETNKELCFARTEENGRWRDVIPIEVVRTRARVAFSRHILVQQQGLVTRCWRPPLLRECSSVRCHQPWTEKPSALGVKGHIMGSGGAGEATGEAMLDAEVRSGVMESEERTRINHGQQWEELHVNFYLKIIMIKWEPKHRWHFSRWPVLHKR